MVNRLSNVIGGAHRKGCACSTCRPAVSVVDQCRCGAALRDDLTDEFGLRVGFPGTTWCPCVVPPPSRTAH